VIVLANGGRHGRRGDPTVREWTGIPRERVVAVRIKLADGRWQVGSGYLVSPNCVLTAWHCTVDKRNPEIPVRSVQVVGGGRKSVVIAPENITSEPELDIAVLRLPKSPWGGGSEWGAPDWARVDRSATGKVADCEAVGFPLWQMDPTDETRSIAELRGTIRRLEDATSRDKFLVFRDVELSDVGVPESVRPLDKNSRSVWGGLSGALVFAAGRGIGIVVQHHPRQGSAAIRVLPIDRVVEASTANSPAIAKALFLPTLDRFPWAFPDTTGALA